MEVFSWMEQHQFITTTFLALFWGSASGGIISTLFNQWSQKSINKASEKIKHDMQRQDMHIEIKTRMYRKLYRLIRKAGPLIVFFDIIHKKINGISTNQEQYLKELNLLIQNYYQEDLLKVSLQRMHPLANLHESSSLFISESVDKTIKEIRELFKDLYNLFKNEIANNLYQDYTYEQCIDLINRANNITIQLTQVKENLKQQMHKELHPY